MPCHVILFESNINVMILYIYTTFLLQKTLAYNKSSHSTKLESCKFLGGLSEDSSAAWRWTHLKTKQEDKRSPIYGDRPSCWELFYKWKFSAVGEGAACINWVKILNLGRSKFPKLYVRQNSLDTKSSASLTTSRRA